MFLTGFDSSKDNEASIMFSDREFSYVHDQGEVAMAVMFNFMLEIMAPFIMDKSIVHSDLMSMLLSRTLYIA